MRIQRPKFDLDLAQIGDEELVIMAKECGYEAARAELLSRHYPVAQRLIGYWSRHTPMKREDVEDAQQNSTFAVMEAIRKYDTAQLARTGGCSFRTFLGRVLQARYRDFQTHLARRTKREKNVQRSAVLGIAPASSDGRDWSEASERLHSGLDALERQDREFMHELLAGHKLRLIASEWNLSYDAAKRRRRKLIGLLTVQLREQLREPTSAGA